MQSEFHANVARLLHNGQPVGSGMILPGGWILTCAHVACEALTGSPNFGVDVPKGTIRFDIRSGGKRRELVATFSGCDWGPANEELWDTAGDYAFLKIVDADIPLGLDMVRTGIESLSKSTALFCYGFSADASIHGRSASLAAASNLHGEGDGLVRVHPAQQLKDSFIEPGFSGAPVLGPSGPYGVVGMIKARRITSTAAEAFIIPNDVLHPRFSKLLRPQTREPDPVLTIRAVLGTIPGHSFISIKTKTWRALNPRFAYNPLSGEGASRFGGRFNAIGTPALHMSLTPEGALLEFQAGLTIEPCVMVQYEVDCSPVFDARNEAALREFGLTPSDIRGPYRPAMEQGQVPPSHILANRLISEGFVGLIYHSSLPHKPPITNMVLWNFDSSLN